MKTFEFLSEENEDGSVALNFMIDEHGNVLRQDTWQGKPKRLLGFNYSSYQIGTMELYTEFSDFIKDPSCAIGLYPIFEHEGDTYEDPGYNLPYGHTYDEIIVLVKEYSKEPVLTKEFILPSRGYSSEELKQVQKDVTFAELRPLADEARKYKNVEEFVKAQELLFHGTSKESAENVRRAGGFTDETAKGLRDLTGFDFDPKRPVSLTLDKKAAELYVSPRPSGGAGELLTFSSKNLSLASIKQADGKTIEQLRKEGFDGFHKSSPHDELVETVVFNKEKLKLTSEKELTDIFNRVR